MSQQDKDAVVRFLVKLSKWDAIGSIEVIPAEDTGWDGSQVGDITVNWDYCCDELPDSDKDLFVEWLYRVAVPEVQRLMQVMGYSMVDENDGSGGGLYYGYETYRKI